MALSVPWDPSNQVSLFVSKPTGPLCFLCSEKFWKKVCWSRTMESPVPCSEMAVHDICGCPLFFARGYGSLGLCRTFPKAQLLSPYLHSPARGPLGQEKVAFVYSSQVYLSYYNVSSLKTLMAKDNWVLSVEISEVTHPPFFSLRASKAVSARS